MNSRQQRRKGHKQRITLRRYVRATRRLGRQSRYALARTLGMKWLGGSYYLRTEENPNA